MDEGIEFDDIEAEQAPLTADSCSITVLPGGAGIRVDLFVASQFSNVSRAEAQRLIGADVADSNGVRVNGLRVRQNYRLKTGDNVTCIRGAPVDVNSRALPESIPLDIVYEDSEIIVINKVRGMVVHPAPGSHSGTLVNAILAHASDLSGIGGEIRPGIVHRLDKDTGGLLVVAKNDTAHRSLQAQIQARTAERKYKAVIWGVPSFERATVNAPIGRHPVDRKKMAVITDTTHISRSAITELRVVNSYSGVMALVEAKLQTGRTHQIRVHCAYVRHPVVGDTLYGGIRNLPAVAFPSGRISIIEQAINSLAGQALHACSLAFDHPKTGERLMFTVPLALPIQRLIDALS